MLWFKLPLQSKLDIHIPVSEFSGRFENKGSDIGRLINEDVASIYLHARLNNKSYPISCESQSDSYFNEVLFFSVELQQQLNSETIGVSILRAVPYQAVVVLKHGNECCFVVGFTRDARRGVYKRVVDRSYVTHWINQEALLKVESLDIERMDRSTYKALYQSMVNIIKTLYSDRYLTLTFASEMYAYTHGRDQNWNDYFAINNMIKARYPENLTKKMNGEEIFRFSEDDVFEIICRDAGYVTGEDLLETLYYFTEFEDDFDIRLPERLRNRLVNSGYYDMMMLDGFMDE